MSREIKFRAWTLTGYDDSGNDTWEMIGSESLAFNEYAPLGSLLQDDPDQQYFMQYTGLKDKNGVEIYEGDIVKHPDATHPEDKGWVCEWRASGFEFRCVRLVNEEVEWVHLRNCLSMEVIGNIHEHKHLLEDDKEK